MILFYVVTDPSYVLHNTGIGHPEQSARVVVINRSLEKAGLKHARNTLVPRKANEEEVVLCHPSDYFQLVQREVSTLAGTPYCTHLSTGDVVISEHSFDIALRAVGAVLTAIDKVVTEKGSTAYCIVRPPGHHACSNRGMGFCLFNNVAIGARYAQQKWGIRKVLIADWDVHHGNGTQEIFYEDPSIFYFSTHEAGIYPNTGFREETGRDLGKGFTLNIPIQAGRSSREEVLKAFDVDLREHMKQFKPDLVILSAGFDGHQEDPLGHFNLVDEDFSTLTRIVKEIANEYSEGRIISVLEGGYNLESIARASVAHAVVLGNLPPS